MKEPSNTTFKAAVVGASGFLGLNLVHGLLGAGISPLCTYRGAVPRLTLLRTGVQTVPGDLDSPSSLALALAGCDVVFHCAGHYPRYSLDRDRTLRRGLAQLEGLLDACATSGVRRLVYLSSTATVAPAPAGPSREWHRFASPPGFGVYHDLKWMMEERALAEDRFEVIVLCPGACLGPWDLRVGTSAILVALARGLKPAHPDGWINLVDARDVAAMAVRVASHSDPPGRLVVSAENYRLHALLIKLAERYAAPSPPKPLSAAEAIALADTEERRVHTHGGRPAISRELVDLICNGVEIDGSRASAITGVPYRPLANTLNDYDAWARDRRILPKLPIPEAVS
jgi:dihydroflavonol-4-reductase